MNQAFQVHTLNDQGKMKALLIAQIFDQVLTRLMETCGDGHYFFAAKEKLEIACFFAKKAMASQEENQIIPGAQ
jgi:hypothetical protein